MRRKDLFQFNRCCDAIILQQGNNEVEVTVTDGDGKEIPFKRIDNNNGITAEQVQPESECQVLYNGLLQLKQQLQDILRTSNDAIRAAKQYQSYADDDLGSVKQRKGFSEGRRAIAKKVIKKLQELGVADEARIEDEEIGEM